MTKLLIPLVLALTPAVGLTVASAEAPASVHGVVYACESRQPLAAAHVTLRGLDDGSVLHLRSDTRGRFSHVGLMPGRWQIQAGTTSDVRDASTRQALLETDDALSMVIGVRTSGASLRSADPKVTHTDCDPFRVPAAPSVADRYIIH